MASAVKKSIARVTGGDDADAVEEADKYRLLVTAGPSYDTSQHQTIPVNGTEAVVVSNDFITAKVKVRVRGYKGFPSSSPASNPYFDDPVHAKDQYSIAFSFVPKRDLPSLDTVWGNDFDHPIRDRLPPGFNTAFKIVKEFIDPGLSCDAYADEPWLYGPSLSCWFAFHIGDSIADGADFPAPDDEHVTRDGAAGSGVEIRERHRIPENNEKRRKFFLDAQNRGSFVFEKGRVYQADFYNPYIDFGNLSLKLPGFSLKAVKYIDHKSHCLRYIFKNRETGEVYLNVNFNLLWGEKLQEALAKETRHEGLMPMDASARKDGQADAEPSRTRSSQSEPSQEEPSQAEPSRAGPSQAEPLRTDPSQTDPSQTDPSQTKSLQHDHVGTDSTATQHPAIQVDPVEQTRKPTRQPNTEGGEQSVIASLNASR